VGLTSAGCSGSSFPALCIWLLAGEPRRPSLAATERRKMTRENSLRKLPPREFSAYSRVSPNECRLSNNPRQVCHRHGRARIAHPTEDDVLYIEGLDHLRDGICVSLASTRIEGGGRKLSLADTAGSDDGAHRQPGAARYAKPATASEFSSRRNQRRRRHRRQEAGADNEDTGASSTTRSTR